MTKQELRLLYKRETGLLPDGSMLSLNGNPLSASMDKELSAYIDWLEFKVLALGKVTIDGKLLTSVIDKSKKL